MAVAGTLADPEASSDQETPKKIDAPSSCLADLEVLSVSVRFSLDKEEKNAPDATFLGVALVARATPDGVAVPWGTN